MPLRICPYCGVHITFRGYNRATVKDGQWVCSSCRRLLKDTKMEIHVEGSNHREVMEVSSNLIGQTSSEKAKSEAEVRLEELEHEYSLAKAGLLKGSLATIMAFVAGILSLSAALIAFLVKGPGFISGNQLVVMFAIMAGALIIYFSFVFGRAAKLKMEINKQRRLLEMSSGDNVRK